ncbi:Riboflavin kinase [Golovinomyces cichoracearum]|uniref:Riboflavin kinase n=1 Tax=Golovinomyces cichoracearum TaxID=62708 RepID=A0A420IS09_9PEZI|nr:Riboflavin kinase [Golovinomyces cichoracearum]
MLHCLLLVVKKTIIMAESQTKIKERDLIIGQDSGPEPPFPLRLGGDVMRGFGRGSEKLGCPTANLPVDTLTSKPWIESAKCGVYIGWCTIRFPQDHPALTATTRLPSSRILSPDYVPPTPGFQLSKESLEKGWRLYPMVISIGYNPFFKNTTRSAEAHVLAGFEKDFYGCEMRVCLLGFVRNEEDYENAEALIDDIRIDCEVTRQSLSRTNWNLSGELWKKEVEWLNGNGDV